MAITVMMNAYRNNMFRKIIQRILIGFSIFAFVPLCFGAEPGGDVNGELLYNGIRLPEQWPPPDRDPRDTSPMDVPYLRSSPSVVPIDVGRQLFIDDFLIEKTTLKRTFHKAMKFDGNPLLTPETPYEMARANEEGIQEGVVYLGHGGVFWDPQINLFRMWYTAGWRGGLAYAVSRDAIEWIRPDLQLAGGNLVLAPGLTEAGWDNAMWLDLETDNPDERVKFLTQRSGSDHDLLVSPDGFKWESGVPAGRSGDYCSFFYNPFRKKWIHSIKRDGPRGRTRYYSESDVFNERNVFDRSVFWVGADELDPPDPRVRDAAQLYSLNGVAYESIILGMFYIHLGPANHIAGRARDPKITELHVGYSRDGFHWDRPDRQPFIPASRERGTWDKAYLHSTNGVVLVVGDWLYFPYTGYSGVSPRGLRGMYSGASVGMAYLRRDGFASMDAEEEPGELVTRPVKFSGDQLFVNVDAPEGQLLVEVLDVDGNVLEPFSMENCIPVSTDRTLWAVNWFADEDLGSIAETPVRFRFRLENGSLYSFWVSQDPSGASGGYVGAGGPGFTSSIDDKGTAAYRFAERIIPESLSQSSQQQ